MKTVKLILADPYVHLIAVSLLVVRLATGEDDSAVLAADEVITPPLPCARCLSEHGSATQCRGGLPPLVTRTNLPVTR
jgi:hypothetical protein